MQVITGIPYFYRQFGYEYAVPIPTLRVLALPPALSIPPGFGVRDARPADVSAIVALQASELARADITCVRDHAAWEAQLGGTLSMPRCVVATRDEAVEGVACCSTWPDGRPVRRSVAAASSGAAVALLAETVGERSVMLEDRPGSVMADVAAPFLGRSISRGGLYVRVPEPALLLGRLKPVLERRISESAWQSSTGSFRMSFYRQTFVIDHDRGRITSIQSGPGDQYPWNYDIAIPPDLVASLILGRHGAAGLETRHDDVRLDGQAQLAEVLFPRLSADLLLFT
jgi:hypothetical protein